MYHAAPRSCGCVALQLDALVSISDLPVRYTPRQGSPHDTAEDSAVIRIRQSLAELEEPGSGVKRKRV